MKKAILALGTNLKDKLENLKNAINFLENVPDTNILKISKIYETEPFEVPDKQENYYNCCILIETGFNPHILLGICLGIEIAMGRKRPYKNASKIIDIDLVYYESEICNDPHLILPHPRAKDRAFVLAPTLDVLDFDDNLKRKIKLHLEKLDTSGIKNSFKIKN